MAKPFARRKHDILRQLSVTDAAYSDLSPKGSVDEGIRELVAAINQLDGYVTTSSCAGRVAVFLDSSVTPTTDPAPTAPTITSLQSGKGTGNWLYVSHDPIDEASIQSAGDVLTLFGLRTSPPSCPVPQHHSRLVHFKFEPMILHILTSSLAHAQRAHSAAMSAGFRESGIGGVDTTETGGSDGDHGDGPTPLVAVRSSGLALESIIGYQDDAGVVQPMVSEDYLRLLVRLANDRFRSNAERKQRFVNALFASSKADDSWEPADVRRVRKRAEGLRRRDELAGKDPPGEVGGFAREDDVGLIPLDSMLQDPAG